MTSSRRLAALLVALVLLASCAARRPDAAEHDPWEGLNRKMFVFNDKLDVYALEPAATGWSKVTPLRLRTSISNFFQNLRVPINGVNGLLQGKPVNAASDLGRFTVNTTIGLAGFLDPATSFGLVRHDEDFGQTLGVWGVPGGPYLVLPLFGPSSPRDAAGLAVDALLSPEFYFAPWYVSYPVTGTRVINARSLALETVRDERAAAFDFYAAVRIAYVQYRANQLRDRAAEPEEHDENEDLYNLEEEE